MQFDVFSHKNSNPYPLLIEVQSDIIDLPGRRVMVPLVHHESFSEKVSNDLCPEIRINNETYRAVIYAIGTVPERFLTEVVGDVSHHGNEIKDALYRMIWGF
ncbi:MULTISPECIES: CcdB family protein [Pantoea]|uniref:Toxin CcdB n=1 Tax=Candidatus Pantoea floridensis TaxID=1938870 RepID=A0A286BLB2_9GAMM|nr:MULTISPECIES: CcdB family protein [Pantoea]PIF22282.1 toxin CcdB [Enterobacteriaceae bacterium JKS000233]PXW22264.1 toxin CcdB [Pantoea sp. JKS000250]SOD34933.1 toxin CcdB [Pantoea floridensis]